MKGFFIFGLCLSPAVFYAQIKKDSVSTTEIEAINFTKRLPVAKEIINVQRDLKEKNLAQDLPILLKNQMSVVSTSDAGNGVGYTGWRIRGTSGSGINVMLNGVPYNDSESFGTFFVNVSDLASSASNILIQRGVGTSTNGVASFGASVNVTTKSPEEKAYALTNQSYGSFNTRRHTIELGSGKFWNNKLSLMGRYSITKSDGYIDRAFSDLNSYNFTALFEDKGTRLRFMAFGGKEKTYLAWNGITMEDFQRNPRTNYSGAIYANGNISKYYDNETDNYRQNHHHLLWQQKLNSIWNLETTLHYTKGRGFYENYKQNDKLSKYLIPSFDFNGKNISRADFIRYKWLDNDFYGAISTLYGKLGDLDLIFGAVANQYKGVHFGNVSPVLDFGNNIPNHNEYYRNHSVKNELSGYAKALYRWDRFEFFGDLQLRNINYTTQIDLNPSEGINTKNHWTFFNPKAGINYALPQGKLYLSYAIAHREPNREDLKNNPNTKAEQLHNIELGIEKQISNWLSFNTNGYLMHYKNQLVLIGKLNDVGSTIRENSGKSYRLGLETGLVAKLNNQFKISGNTTISQNKNVDFHIKTTEIVSGKQVDLPKNIGNTQISYSPSFIANISAIYNPTQNFTLTLTNQYVGKQYLDNTQNDTLKLPSYNVLDFLAHYQLKVSRYDLGLNLMVNNLLNRKYANNGYVYDGAIVYPQAGTNFMLGMTLKFQ